MASVQASGTSAGVRNYELKGPHQGCLALFETANIFQTRIQIFWIDGVAGYHLFLVVHVDSFSETPVQHSLFDSRLHHKSS